MKLPFNAVLLTYPRSGTHMLQSSLAKHPDIYMSNEIFHPAFSSKEIVNGGLNTVLDHWFGNAPDKKIKMAVIHLTHAKPGDEMTEGTDCYKIWNMLYHNSAIKVIMLRRGSYLQRYVSHRIAGMNNVFNIYEEAHRPAEKIRISMLDYFENIIRTDQLYRETLAYLRDHKLQLVWYEQMTDNFGLTLNEIFRFLNVEPLKVTPDPIKKEVRGMQEVIENYSELQEFFKNHPFALF